MDYILIIEHPCEYGGTELLLKITQNGMSKDYCSFTVLMILQCIISTRTAKALERV
jgi:hypothetical protein